MTGIAELTGSVRSASDHYLSHFVGRSGTFIGKMPTEDFIQRAGELADEVDRLQALLHTPEIEDFDKAVPLEAAHQLDRWGVAHDDGKEPEDWFWLIGYLAGKALAALKAGDVVKAKHHCISTAAALRNWHAHVRQGWTIMRPGIATPDVGER